jgi:hypothetical protein
VGFCCSSNEKWVRGVVAIDVVDDVRSRQRVP